MEKIDLHKAVAELKKLQKQSDYPITIHEFCSSTGILAGHVSALGGFKKIKQLAQEETEQDTKPKILIIDIEVSHLLVYVFRIGSKININHTQVKEDWYIMSFAAKWHDSNEVTQFDVRDTPREDNELCKKLWLMMEEADVVIGQNSDAYDLKKINERFLFHGLEEYSNIRTIDTLKISRRRFSPTSHKLDYRTNQLNKKHKKSKHEKFHGEELWFQCYEGNNKAWDEMASYNKKDVLSTQEYWEKIRSWDNSFNFIIYGLGKKKCICGSKDFKRAGYKTTNTGKFQLYRCTQCKKKYQSKHNELSKEQREEVREFTGVV